MGLGSIGRALLSSGIQTLEETFRRTGAVRIVHFGIKDQREEERREGKGREDLLGVQESVMYPLMVRQSWRDLWLGMPSENSGECHDCPARVAVSPGCWVLDCLARASY